MRSYRYEPLSTDHRIRILELQTGKHEDALRAHLTEVELTTEPYKPLFAALSYTWGAPIFDTDLNIDGQILKITKSLAAALRRIRTEDGIRLLWVDQVCINQQDIPERNSQVKLMGQIYTKAAKVIVWLGEGAEHAPPLQHQGRISQWLHTEQVADVTESRLENLIDRLAKAQLKRLEDGDIRNKHQLQWVGLEKYDLPDMSDPGYSAFLRLLQRKYFSRGWILQEVALSSDHSVYFGTAKVPLTHFNWAVSICMSLGYEDDENLRTDDFQRFLSIMAMRQTVDEKKSMDFLKLLLRTRATMTTNPLDKIYCLLGLANDRDLLSIEPTYEDSVENVYRNFALRHIEAYGHLDILTVPRLEEHSTLPSWTPDWRLGGAKHILSLDGRDAEQICQYRATKGTQASITASSNPNVIGLSVYSIDTVVECGRREESAEGISEKTIGHTFNTGLCFRLQFLDWKRVALMHTWKPYITGETREDAFISCMTAGRAFEPNTNFDVIRKNYRAWTRFLFLYPTLLWIFPEVGLSAIFWLMMFLRGCRNGFALCCFLPLYRPNRRQEAFTNLCLGTHGRIVIRTTQGYIALAPETTEKGDSIVLCKGGKLPFVMRRKEENWVIVGDCYVHGIMSGEVFDERKCETMWIQ